MRKNSKILIQIPSNIETTLKRLQKIETETKPKRVRIKPSQSCTIKLITAVKIRIS